MFLQTPTTLTADGLVACPERRECPCCGWWGCPAVGCLHLLMKRVQDWSHAVHGERECVCLFDEDAVDWTPALHERVEGRLVLGRTCGSCRRVEEGTLPAGGVEMATSEAA